jgi:hypothetical protein
MRGNVTPVVVVPMAVSSSGIDRGKKRDGVLVEGVNSSGEIIYGTAGNSSGDITIYKVQQPSDTATLTNIASSYLSQLNTDSAGCTLSLTLGDGVNLNAGDYVYLSSEYVVSQLGIPAGDHRIMRVRKFQDHVDIEIDRVESILEEQNQGIDVLAGSTVGGVVVPNAAISDLGMIPVRNGGSIRFMDSGDVAVGGFVGYSAPSGLGVGFLMYSLSSDLWLISAQGGSPSVNIIMHGLSGTVEINAVNGLFVNGTQVSIP